MSNGRWQNVFKTYCRDFEGTILLLIQKITLLKESAPKNRGQVLSHSLISCATRRMDTHVEKLNYHPLEIRRYYRQFDY